MATAAASRTTSAQASKPTSTPTPQSTKTGGWSVSGWDQKDIQQIHNAALQTAKIVRRHVPIDNLRIVASCSALQIVAAAAIKNLPYVHVSNQLGINTVPSALSSRATWSEAWGMSSSAAVHNFTWGVFFILGTIFTMGKNEECKYAAKKHMVHVAISVAAIGVSIAGAIAPTLGEKAASLLALAIGTVLYARYRNYPWDARLTNMIGELYQQNREYIVKHIEERGIEDKVDPSVVQKEIKDLDDAVRNAKTFNDLTTFMKSKRSGTSF
jgi:hypothetical protein